MTLPVVPTESANEKQHRTIIATVLNELAKQFPQHLDWTPVIRGSGTAGTYEIDSNQSRYTRIGRRVWLDLDVTLAAVITAGGTSLLQIIDLPFTKAANTFPVGSVLMSGVNWTAGANLTVAFFSSAASATLTVYETNDDAALAALAISALAAGDRITASICYETDDP